MIDRPGRLTSGPRMLAAVALVNKARREGRTITDADSIRNICRCGTYTPHP